MARTLNATRILLIEDTDNMAVEAAALGLTSVEFTHVCDARVVDVERTAGFDAVVVNINIAGGFDLLERLCRSTVVPPIVAVAAKGIGAHTLEHTLTLAELRGAALALPKPLDTVELAIACIQLLTASASKASTRATLDANLARLLAAA